MSESKTHSSNDWHPETIKSEIRKKAGSVAELARANGYKSTHTFMNVFRMPYPKIQNIIADYLEVPAKEIWPSRYQQPTKITPSIHRKVA